MAETKTYDFMAYCGLDCSRCFGYTKTISYLRREGIFPSRRK